VYVEGRDEVIDLETQAGVVTELEDEIDVRFVDERGEAVEEDDPGEPVRGDSVLLRLGPVSTGGDPVEVEVERYRSLDDVEELRLELARRGEGWTVSASSPSGASR
jgi:hypothetical protein